MLVALVPRRREPGSAVAFVWLPIVGWQRVCVLRNQLPSLAVNETCVTVCDVLYFHFFRSLRLFWSMSAPGGNREGTDKVSRRPVANVLLFIAAAFLGMGVNGLECP